MRPRHTVSLGLLAALVGCGPRPPSPTRSAVAAPAPLPTATPPPMAAASPQQSSMLPSCPAPPSLDGEAPRPAAADRTARTPAPIALIFVIDRSGTMAGKLDCVLHAVLRAITSLTEDSLVGVTTFDRHTEIAAALGEVGTGERLAEALAPVRAGGGTDILPALEAAHRQLVPARARIKRVILLIDGRGPGDGLEARVRRMAADGIEVSAIDISDADPDMMRMIGTLGGGRVHFVDDLGQLVEIFTREASR